MMEKRILYQIMPILKVILFIFFILICLIPFGIIAQLEFIHFDKDSIFTNLIIEGSLVLAIIGALLMMFKVFPTLYFDDVFVVKQNTILGFFKGTAIGFCLIILCATVLYLLGYVAITPSEISIPLFAGYFAFFIIVAVFEELMFRTFPLFVFAERYPVVIAILINGLLFGFVHMTNPGFTWIAMVNITLAGALFSVYTLLKKNISWAIGIHFGWNFTQGILLGYKVSGTNTPSILSAKPIGENYISGGVFGIEGSIICTIVLLVLIIFILMRHKIEPIEVENNLTLEE